MPRIFDIYCNRTVAKVTIRTKVGEIEVYGDSPIMAHACVVNDLDEDWAERERREEAGEVVRDLVSLADVEFQVDETTGTLEIACSYHYYGNKRYNFIGIVYYLVMAIVRARGSRCLDYAVDLNVEGPIFQPYASSTVDLEFQGLDGEFPRFELSQDAYERWISNSTEELPHGNSSVTIRKLLLGALSKPPPATAEHPESRKRARRCVTVVV